MDNKKYASAPFNFVPFPSRVIERYVSKEQIPGHERYYKKEEGFYSGEISYDIQIDSKTSALMIGGEDNKEYKEFFKNPDGDYAIPGNSVRGLIRSNVQILGMCRMKNDIDDTTFLYRDWVSTDKRRKEHYKAEVDLREEGGLPGKVRAGYLYMDRKDHYVLCPAKTRKIEKSGKEKDLWEWKTFYKISEEKLRRMAGPDPHIRYMYGEELLSLTNEELKDVKRLGRCRNKDYRPYQTQVVFNTDQDGQVVAVSTDLYSGLHNRGYLMCAGYIGGKRAHYIIHEMDSKSEEKIEFSSHDQEIRAYQEDLKRTKSKDYFYALPNQVGPRYKKPVFYVHGGSATYFGRMPYLRIFYPHSVWEGIPERQNSKGIDYAQAMFGFSSKGKKKGELIRGHSTRLNFTDAVGREDIEFGNVRSILPGEPKATCYPEYLVQDKADQGILDSYADDFKIRGMKQYWIIDKIRQYQNLSGKQNSKVLVNIKPIIKGSFSGKIYFENLTKDELGLLTYAICLTDQAWQNMGMAKAYGYGRIRFCNVEVKVYNFDVMYSNFALPKQWSQPMDTKELINFYKEYVRSSMGIDLDREDSIRDFLFMKEHVMAQKETAYQNLEEFKKKRILPTVREIRERQQG